uniref:Uncharacterized protein n=1 Tax=Marseillevirus LCMAC101 TaxID=2506602 RepID=A0A481YSY8_9VIRU|nr:MAG: hypothetical protein LCMAC101_04800 [Marseillevirus LCMAC101]
MATQPEVWEGLAVVICSHLDKKYGSQRIEYIRDLIPNILEGDLLPEKIVISYTQVKEGYDCWKHDLRYIFSRDHIQDPRLEIICRGSVPISQMNQLLVTTYELPDSINCVLLVDDDDLISPQLLSTYKKIWDGSEPEHFVFECGMTRGGGYEDRNIRFFSQIKNMELMKDLFSKKVNTNYGGTLFSKSVLKYYFRYCISRGCNFAHMSADVSFKMCVANANHLVSENQDPLFVTNCESLKIFKAVVEKPLYFYRKWRYIPYIKSYEDIQKIIDDIKKYGCY